MCAVAFEHLCLLPVVWRIACSLCQLKPWIWVENWLSIFPKHLFFCSWAVKLSLGDTAGEESLTKKIRWVAVNPKPIGNRFEKTTATQTLKFDHARTKTLTFSPTDTVFQYQQKRTSVQRGAEKNMVVGGRRADVCVSQIADLLGFSRIIMWRVSGEKPPGSSSLRGIVLLMVGVCSKLPHKCDTNLKTTTRIKSNRDHLLYRPQRAGCSVWVGCTFFFALWLCCVRHDCARCVYSAQAEWLANWTVTHLRLQEAKVALSPLFATVLCPVVSGSEWWWDFIRTH